MNKTDVDINSQYVFTRVLETNGCASMSCLCITNSSYMGIHVSVHFADGSGLLSQFSGSLKGYCIRRDRSSEKRDRNTNIWPGVLCSMYHSRSTLPLSAMLHVVKSHTQSDMFLVKGKSFKKSP